MDLSLFWSTLFSSQPSKINNGWQRGFPYGHVTSIWVPA